MEVKSEQEILVTSTEPTAPETTPEVVEPVEPIEETEPPEYVPDYKFKVHDEEYEIDEMYRPLMKDQESAEKVRSLFLKATGLPKVQEGRERYKKERDEAKATYGTLNNQYSELKSTHESMVDLIKNNFEEACYVLGIPEQSVFNLASKYLKFYDENNPQGRTMLESERKRASDNYNTSREVEVLRREKAKSMENEHNLSLQSALSDPEITPLAQRYDQLKGEGSFLKRVNETGDLYYLRDKTYLSPGQVVKLVVQDIQPFLNLNNQGSGVVGTPPTQAPTSKPPVIPNVGSGGSTSPVRKKITSIKDLEALAESFRE